MSELLSTSKLFAAFRVFTVVCGVSLLVSACAGRKMVLSEGEKGFSGQSKPAVVKPTEPKQNYFPIYFVKLIGNELKYVEVSREYKGPYTTTDYVDFVANELMKGPNGTEAADGLATEVPKGAVVIGVNETGKDHTLNLSKSFVQGGGLDSFEIRMEQLRRTIASAVPKEKVFLDIEGERLTRTVGDGLEVKQPLNSI